MSRLFKKFMVSILLVLLMVISVSVYLNSNFIERYFLFREKREIELVMDLLLDSSYDVSGAIEDIESSYNVVVGWVLNSDDNESLNDRIRESFLDKGLGLDEYWLWEQDQVQAANSGRKLRVYNQERLNYRLLVGYVDIGENFFAIAKVVPIMESTIGLINLVTAFVFGGASLLIAVFVYFLVRRIIVPLKAIGDTANAIAMLDFRCVSVKTGDELELLADNINYMSMSLRESHSELERKNQQMKDLLSNVSHDLKTPIALVKAYLSGIRDGMDDGSFLEVIAKQNERMEVLVNRLLEFAKIGDFELAFCSVNFSEVLMGEVDLYRVLQGEKRIVCDVDNDVIFEGCLEMVQCIFSNLISNGVRYSSDGVLFVKLKRFGEGVLFETRNRFDDGEGLDLDRLWEPFFVGEESRSREFSGTGLGLAIVKSWALRMKATHFCEFREGDLVFSFIFSEKTP